MDGVIIDSEPAHKEVLEKVFGELNLNFSDAYHQTLVGMAAVPMWEKIKADFTIETNARELMNFHKEIFFIEAENLKIEAVPEVVSLIKRLKEMNYHLSLASSSSLKLIERFTEELAVKDYFDFLVSGESLERSKPFPDIFLKVAENYKLDSSRFVVIEDSKNGVAAAKAAEMFCIGYQNPNSGNQNLSQADVVIDDFSKLTPEVITKMTN